MVQGYVDSGAEEIVGNRDYKARTVDGNQIVKGLRGDIFSTGKRKSEEPGVDSLGRSFKYTGNVQPGSGRLKGRQEFDNVYKIPSPCL